MDFNELKSLVLDKHSGDTQREGLAKVHLDAIAEAMQALRNMGHNVALSFSDARHVPKEYPKALYNSDGDMRVVDSSDEAADAFKAGFRPLGVATSTTEAHDASEE